LPNAPGDIEVAFQRSLLARPLDQIGGWAGLYELTEFGAGPVHEACPTLGKPSGPLRRQLCQC
jgi:hypothetical protein